MSVKTEVCDFLEMKDAPRLLVLGSIGAGKSALCNRVLGVKYLETDDGDFEITNGQTERFKQQYTQESVTRDTAFTEGNFLRSGTPFVCIDTQGVGEGSEDLNKAHARDLQLKLTHCKYVNCVLICIPIPDGGRYPQHLMDFHDRMNEIFPDQGLWEGTILAFMKCDPIDRSWKRKRNKAKKGFQEFIRLRYNREVKDIVFLSAVEPEDGESDRDAQEGFAKILNALETQKISTKEAKQTESMFEKQKRECEEKLKMERERAEEERVRLERDLALQRLEDGKQMGRLDKGMEACKFVAYFTMSLVQILRK